MGGSEQTQVSVTRSCTAAAEPGTRTVSPAVPVPRGAAAPAPGTAEHQRGAAAAIAASEQIIVWAVFKLNQ